MKKLIWFLFGVSVAANIWLALSRSGKATHSVATSSASRKASAGAAGSLPASQSTSTKSAAAESAETKAIRAALVKKLATVNTDDFASLRDEMRAAGVNDSMIYATAVGVAHLRYYRATREAEIESLRTGWWRGNTQSQAGINAIPNGPSWNKMAVTPLLEAFGHDPYDVIDFGSRFDFLPPEKATIFAKMAVDYAEMQARFTEDPNVSNPKQAVDMLMAERRKDVLTQLSPEERAEYDLRFSESAAQNARRFTRMQATEKEYRAIAPILEQLQKEPSPPRDQNYLAATQAIEQRTFDQLVEAVGYDRAVDYVWSGATATGRNALSGAMTALPSPAYTGQFMQLAAETGAAAASIHADPTRSVDEKRAALAALQQATQPKLDQILPAESRADLDPQALRWFNGLAKGEYVLITPRLSGDGIPMSALSITSPARPTVPAIPQARPSK